MQWEYGVWEWVTFGRTQRLEVRKSISTWSSILGTKALLWDLHSKNMDNGLLLLSFYFNFFSNLFVPWLSVSGTEYPAEGGYIIGTYFLDR